MKVTSKNTIFWCWIWALIHANQFIVTSNTSNLKHTVYQHAFPYHWAIRDDFFQKISITYNLGQNFWDKIANLFFSEKTSLPQNQCCWKSFRPLTTKPGQIQHWIWRVRGRNWNLKNWVISWIYWIFNFCRNKFCPGLWDIFETETLLIL